MSSALPVQGHTHRPFQAMLLGLLALLPGWTMPAAVAGGLFFALALGLGWASLNFFWTLVPWCKRPFFAALAWNMDRLREFSLTKPTR